MKVLVSGSSGMVGSALIPRLREAGHEVVRLMRGGAGEAGPAVNWDPARGRIDSASLEGVEGVVHLAGESISAGRWNADKKERIRESRVAGTRLLAGALAGLERPPRVMACASAIGYYGDRGEQALGEDQPPGSGFLSEVCVAWEAACEPARAKGIRVVNLRIGVVLAAEGGALQKMLPPFKFGAGGPMGSGRQFWSWVALDDLCAMFVRALEDESISGPVNAVAPQPVTSRDFARTLGKVLKRPAFLPLPAFAARLVLGEMADALLLASTRVEPALLQAAGFEFQHPDLEGALRHALGR